MAEARTVCAVCGSSGTCLTCEGTGMREFPGKIRIACAECEGTGRCPACAGAPQAAGAAPSK
jgi:hypothetical protein